MGSGLVWSAELDIQVLGLLKNTVILRIEGRQQMLKAGQTSKEGVQVLVVDNEHALIEYQGKRHRLTLSDQISTSFSKSPRKSYSMSRDHFGHYKTVGFINGYKVEMLVDTGASYIAMNSQQAKQLGINFFLDGRRHSVNTASGVVAAYGIMLDKVIVGGIEMRNISASVLVGEYPKQILLGMSYLNHVDIRESGGIMVLEEKY